MVAAGFEADDQRAAAGPFARLTQGAHLGMGGSGALVIALPHQPPGGIEHHGPHQWVGAGAAPPQLGQLQGPAHPGEPGAVIPGRGLRSAHRSFEVGGGDTSDRLRHSATT